MSALGQKQTCAAQTGMSALPPIHAIMPEVVVPQRFVKFGGAWGGRWGKHFNAIIVNDARSTDPAFADAWATA
jgi:hypothetical protein